MNYYNEFDPKAAAWLRELIHAGEIAQGVVDERSIKEVQPDDLAGYAQCHFFAGIGGWSLALRLAGWDDDRPVWTGSCPCQPYSSAGNQEGDADPRNLWPDLFRLIRICRPDVVFGEQVSSAIRHGWLDGISADLEGEGYAVGAVVLGAHSVGAPHIRQRLYWVSDAAGRGFGINGGTPRLPGHTDQRGEVDGLPDANGAGHQRPDRQGLTGTPASEGARAVNTGGNGAYLRLGNGNGAGPQAGKLATSINGHGRSTVADGGTRWMGSPIQPGPQGLSGHGDDGDEPGRLGAGQNGPVAATSDALGPWSDFIVIPCLDGKYRRAPAEPALFPLAHGLSGRVGLLRGAGNAIVPEVAAVFIKAFEEVRGAA